MHKIQCKGSGSSSKRAKNQNGVSMLHISRKCQSGAHNAEYVDARVCVCACVFVGVCVSSLKIAEHKAQSVCALH